jgi:hypothetical protein
MFAIYTREDKYYYVCANSAYGAAGGWADSYDEARVKLNIAEADMFEHPYSPTTQKLMLQNISEVAKDLPDVEVIPWESCGR